MVLRGQSDRVSGGTTPLGRNANELSHGINED
jgi:hypothetical protein